MRSSRIRYRRLLACIASPLLVGCRAPTEVIVELSTDISCADRPQTGISVGSLDQLESRPMSTETFQCDSSTGRIGSIVVLPGSAEDGEFAIRVVSGMTMTPQECARAGYVGGCVVARRVLGFVPHESLYLPIRIEASCIDVPCGATETCRAGACVSALISDRNACRTSSGCDVGPVAASGNKGQEAASGGSSYAAGTSSQGGSLSVPTAGRSGVGATITDAGRSPSGAAGVATGELVHAGGAPSTGGPSSLAFGGTSTGSLGGAGASSSVGTRTDPSGGTSSVALGGKPGTGGAMSSGGSASAVGNSVSGGTTSSSTTMALAEQGGSSGSGGALPLGGDSASPGGSSGSGGAPTLGGNGGAGGVAGGTLAAGVAGTTSAPDPPTCSTTLAGVPIYKGLACTAADPQLCYWPCGPLELGHRTETCASGVYVESGCEFPASIDYSCFAVPLRDSPACPGTIPQTGQPCSITKCILPCGGTSCEMCGLATGYRDSTGTPKIGYCVCSSEGRWSCASTLSWPCPAGPGC